MTKDIFPHLTKEVVKKLGTRSFLINNDALNKKWEMLTLVKIGKKGFFNFNHPRPIDFVIKLDDITDEPICLGSEEEVLVKDFQNLKLDNISIEAGGGVEPVDGEAKGSRDSVDCASPVTLMSEAIRQQDLADLFMRPNKIKLKPGVEDNLKLLKGETLAFVKQRIYNTGDVEVKSKTSTCWSLKAKIYRIITGGSKGEKTEVTTFTVPINKVIAFGLKAITLEDGCLNFDPDGTVHVSVDCSEGDFLENPSVMEALADVPGSTRMDLMKKLTEILEDREALALLEDTLHHYRHGKHLRPQSEAVTSFMDLLDVCKASSDSTKAVHMLVCALQELPDNTAALLAKSDSETLNCIIQMVDGWKIRQAKLPESPPLPLQEEGELHWVAMFLVAANDMGGLNKTWDNTVIRPHNLIELLYISVKGLSRMKAGVSS